MRFLTLACAFLVFVGCKQAPEKNQPEAEPQSELQTELQTEQNAYPASLERVFEAHGGLAQWNTYETLSYQMGEETHTVDLKTRLDRIDHPDYSLGMDRQGIWKSASYEKDPVFYHNLMFYFYAMPFVLADPGINYEEVTPLQFEGTAYPGLRISYKEDVGVSPDDEYFLHYHPETNRMEWLGYTVTYGKDGPSDEVHWIRYSEWQEVKDVLLPATLSWYTYEDGLPKEARNDVKFSEVILEEQARPASFYARPDSAE